MEAAQDYLRQFGYLESPAIEEFGFGLHKAFVADTGDDRAQRALIEFQKFVGLEPTGVLDEATISWMERKRCGFPDVGQFVLQGNKWNVPEVHYTFRELGSDLSTAQLRLAMAEAFALWSAVCNIDFREDPAPDMEIRFVHGDHGDGFGFDGSSGVLAHAFFPPPNGGLLAGDCHFDDAEFWTVGGSAGIDLVTVAAHEIGHALGLAHSNIQGSLMFPYYSGPHRFLHDDDVAGIRTLYGVREAPVPTPPVVPPAPPPVPAPTPPVQPPAAPTPPDDPWPWHYFRMVGSQVFHDQHRVRGKVDQHFRTYKDATALGLRPCLVCRPKE